MIENICCFIPYHKDYQSIHTINLVLETKPQIYNSFKAEAVYKVHYACTLINQGFTSVKEIAAMSGYRDALYFSKVFKRKMGVSPKQYIFSLH